MTDSATFRHSLRTPLNHIIGYAEILLEDAAAPELEEIRRELQGIHTAAYELLRLIQTRFPADAPSSQPGDPSRLQTEALSLLKRIEDHASRLTTEFHFGGRDVLRIIDATAVLSKCVEAPAIPSISEAAVPDGQASATKARLLVVDDDENNRDVLKRLLERIGYQAETASGGEQALAMLESSLFDLILLDIIMPGMDGFQMLSRLKADDGLRGVAVIVTSALDEMRSVSRCIEMGADDFVAKPFDRVILQSRIDAVLRRGAAEKERAQLAERLHLLLESTAEGIFGINQSGECTFINAAAVKLLGRSKEELIGKPIHDVVHAQRCDGSSYPSDECPMNRAAVHAEASRTLDEVFWRANSESFPVEYTSNPIFHDCQLQGAVITFADISERKRTDAKFRESAKLESIGVLAGGVAHDFNNLLTGILGNASLVMDSPYLSNNDREILGYVIQSSKRAADLTKQLLAYAGKGRYELCEVDLSQLVLETTKLIQTTIPRTIRIDLKLDPSIPLVEGDPSQVQQVIMNLVINAGEAIGELRTGTVAIETYHENVDEGSAQRLGVGELQPGLYVVLEVSDTGSGIPPEIESRIFDPFFTTKFTGRGLGLAAVMGIVKSHKGAIHLTSTMGQGTRFRVYLRASTEARQKKKELVSGRGNLTTGLVLVVDDEDIVLRTTQTMLERNGYETLLASGSEEAVNIFRKHASEISVVLLDVMMPEIGGDQAFRHLREIRPDIPIVISSGYNEFHIMQYFSESDVSGFIQKPYSSRLLAEKISAVLEQVRRNPRVALPRV